MKKDINMKILVACHKEDPNIRYDDVYMPIQVGKALHPDVDLGFQTDDTGINISDKNNSYCELTGMYWAWKNLKGVDYIGFCHYRRYFEFDKKVCFKDFILGNSGESYTPVRVEKLIKMFRNNDVILTQERVYPYSLYCDYCIAHIGPDLKILSSVIADYDEMMGVAWNEYVHHTNVLGHYNMFITTWEIFNQYCAWLFEILDKVEKATHIEHYNTFQRRIYGYMAERMLPFWMRYNGHSIQRYPILWYNEGYKRRSKIKDIYYRFRNIAIARLMKCNNKFFIKNK